MTWLGYSIEYFENIASTLYTSNINTTYELEIYEYSHAVDDWLVHSQTTEEIQSKLTTGLILIEYLNGEISIGEVAEHLKKLLKKH